ncbi:MAG: ABC transporter substrate-binding protein [Acidobacteriota bacterium]
MNEQLEKLSLPLLLVLVLAGCDGCNSTTHDQPAVQRGGTLVVGLKAEPDTLNVYLGKLAESGWVANRTLPRLAREIPPGSGEAAGFKPELADRWEWQDEGRTLTFTLHPKGSWSTGQPITCDDVQFTWRAQTSSDLAWRMASLKRHITSVECPGPLTAVFRFDVAYPTGFIDANDLNILPASLGSIPFSAWRQTDWATLMPAGGPFKLERRAAGSEWVLARHDGWQGAPEQPVLDRIVLKPLPDYSSRLNAFLAGDLHIADQIQPVDLPQIAQKPELKVERRTGWSYSYIGWNTIDPAAYGDYRKRIEAACAGAENCPEDTAGLAALALAHPHPLLGDARVRLALTLAIDRNSIVDTLLVGEGEVPATPILAPLPEHDPQLASPPYDAARARALLTEVGFNDTDGDGTIDRNGRPFAITVLVQAGNALRRQAADLIQRDLSKLGIAMTVTPIENSSFFQTVGRREMDAWIGGWVAPTRVDMTEMLHINATPRDGNNYGTWIHADADALALQARDTRDDAARAALWHRWERLFASEQPYTLLFRPRYLVGVRRDVHGTETLISTDILNGVETWWLSPH